MIEDIQHININCIGILTKVNIYTEWHKTQRIGLLIQNNARDFCVTLYIVLLSLMSQLLELQKTN